MTKLKSFLEVLADKLRSSPERKKKIRAHNPHEARIPTSALNAYGNECNEVHEGLVSDYSDKIDFFCHDTDTALGK